MDRGVSPHIAFEDRLMFAIIEDGGRQYRVQVGDPPLPIKPFLNVYLFLLISVGNEMQRLRGDNARP